MNRALTAIFFVVFGVVGMAAMVSITFASSEHDHSPMLGPLAPIGPVRQGHQFRVLCPQLDAGTVAELLVPTDGGTAGIPIDADAIYVAPISGSTVNVRVGFNKAGSGILTPSTGFEVGTSGRDGVGIAMDTTKSPNPVCVSTGNAQAVDVIVGRQ